MACLVSITLIAPLCASLISTKETHQLEFALGRISTTATVTTAQKVLCPCSSNKCIPSANRSCLQSPLTFSRFLSLTSFRNLDVDYFSNRVISGYWVGPDIDDGWGFVEAVIDRIT
ncbi:hypothetical protein L6164_035028 [Bauhinia variegata]|uniref:Uncharacterized protein n=1 Tax=Bauhinia variegata TaxID=167791 RepID=A0ACB9KWI2_BAUVA|nr:hypothetical protein L6164_035028 [Bauhinia variegata]